MPIKPAFSAVELLLVAGMTAILVAIAVPGYMEAKVRAEVVTTQVQMREISGALAQYSIDFNGQLPEKPASAVDTAPLKRLLSMGLLTNEPVDEFKEGLQAYGKYYVNPYITFDYIENKQRIVFGRVLENSGYSPSQQTQSSNSFWYLKSIGPDQTDFHDEGGVRGQNKMNPAMQIVEYDPSNGIFSLGEITHVGRR